MVATRPALRPVVLMNATRRKKTKVWRRITSLISTALLMPFRLRAEAGPAVASASRRHGNPTHKLLFGFAPDVLNAGCRRF